MDNKIIFKKIECPCIFDLEEKTLLCRNKSSSSNATIYNLTKCKHLFEKDLKIIADNNRLFLTYLCNIGRMNDTNFDGCLPIRCLNLNLNEEQGEEEITISPKYLINCFIHLLKTIIISKDNTDIIFTRDDKTVHIPTTIVKMRDMFNSILKTFMKDDIENEMEIDDNDNNNNFADLNQLLKLVMGHIVELQQRSTKKLEKSKKQLSMIGGISQNNFLFSDDNNAISKMLTDCANVIDTYIYNHRTLVLNDNNIIINKIITNNHNNKKIYSNNEISFQDMMDFIGQVFNVLFFKTFPRYSMMLTLQGVIYYVSVLNELQLINYYKNTIQLPILYKLIYSCFKDVTNNDNDENKKIEHYNNWFQSLYPKLYKALTTYVNIINNTNTNDDDTALQCLCNIAIALDISDDSFMDAIYWLFNHHLNSTIEFYLIIIVNIYVQNKCSSLNKNNKISNANTFMKPIYKILILFRNYVREIGIQLAVCDETLTNFSMYYSKEIKEAINDFSLKCLKNLV